MRDELKFWNRISKIYDSFMSSSESLYREITENIKPYLDKDMKVLELAAGSGQISFFLAGSAMEYVASDFSKSMIEKAKDKEIPILNMRYEVIDATSIPYPVSTFDAVIIANALHIMPEPEKALKEIRRVLKSDGILFAPTFVKSDKFIAKLRMSIMGIAGFKTYKFLPEKEMLDFMDFNGWKAATDGLIGPEIMPLSLIRCTKKLSEI